MAKYISGQRLPWKRFWVPWDGNIRCGYDGRGFLDDPDQLWGKVTNPQVRSIDELLIKRCVILSGHPGIGKTVEIEQAQDKFSTQRQPPDELFFFHCRAIASVEMLRAETVAHPRWVRARAANGDITLIVDGIDEGLRKVPEFVSGLALFLRDEPPDRLRVILVCRSAEWDIASGENLTRLWPEKERAGVYELCPLRHQDAEEAARASGLDEHRFMKAIFRHQVQGLAARPITLRMLLDEFSLAGQFPDTRKELYARAARRMCREIDEDRLKALRKHYEPFPEEHVYRTVSRIAAVLMLSAKGVVLKRDNEKPSPVELPWRVLVGGVETIDRDTFEVTERLVEAALETAHFSFRGPHRYGFDHPTFAESLAADYLHELPLIQLRQLLCQRFGDHEFVAPQLAEVAAWLALDHKDWRRFLSANQPAILLRTDVSRFTNEDKKLTVGSLLERADREEAFDEQGISTFYHALRHPNIASQLRPYVIDRNRNPVVRRIAIEIAGDAGVRELEPLLWRLIAADDPAYNAITHALRDLAGRHSKKNLLRALRGGFPGDTNKDLAGVALQVLVPKMISVRAVLPFIEGEREKAYTGSYDTALEWHLPKALVAADVPALLKRMCGWKNCFDTLSPFHHLAERGFALALENLDKPKVRKLAIEMWLQKLRTYEPLPSRYKNEERIKAAGLDDEQRRHEFVRAMLDSGLAAADDVLNFSAPLVGHTDLRWLLVELPQSARKHREQWAKVTAQYIWQPEREKHRDLLLQTYDLVPELRKYLPVPRKGDINVTLDRYQRAGQLRHERMQRKWKRDSQTPSRRELLNRALNVLRKGNSTGWVGIAQYVFNEEGNEKKPANHQNVSPYDITTAPGWQELSESEKKEAIEAARHFLLERDDRRANPNEYTNYAEAGYHAIQVLRERIKTDPRLRHAVKRKWIYAVTDRFNNGEEEHQEQIEVVYRLAPDHVTKRLLLELRLEDKRDGYALALRAYTKAWSRRLSVAVSNFVLNAKLQPQTTKAILQFFVYHDRHRTIKIVRKLGCQSGRAFRLSPRIRAVATVALFSLPDVFWNDLWPRITKASVSQVEQLFLENSWDFVHGESNFFDKLTDRQIGDLYVLLMRLFPPETDPQDKPLVVHSVTPRHKMQRLRDDCTSVLVSRATDSSLEELQRLSTLVPPKLRLWLRWRYNEALKGRLRKLWTAGAPFPKEILTLVRSRTARRVEDEDSLRKAILSSLERLQTEMDSDHLPSVRDLWNEADLRRGIAEKPKCEEELSHLVRRWLNKDLPAKTGIIVNCEVKVERFGRGKLDIKVEAISKSSLAPRKMALIIEVKRCSHSDINTACKTQLVAGYLGEQGLTHGIYLVGWFGSQHGPAAKWKNREDAFLCVEKWANTASRDTLTAKGFVLDCRLPILIAPSKRTKKPPQNDR
jgi:hypothetical protein